MITSNDLKGAAVLSAIFVALLVAAELWRRLGAPKPEWTRKLVHLGGGIACLFFPFLVQSPWVVLAMSLPLTLLFVAGSRFGFLKSLHGIGRKSRGAEYYPLSVFLVFLMTPGRPWLYLAAVLVLAVGDAFAALIGSRYGVIRYEVEDGMKSLEGSLVFLVIAFLAIHLPTLLLTDLPRPVTVLAAVLVAALVTGFEAISLEGADNLFVPLAVVVILGKITTKPLSEVVFQNLSLLAICLGVGLVVWRSRSFNVGGAITFILFAYGTWSLGSWRWALPVFTGFACYLACWLRFAPKGHAIGIKVRTLARALLPPFLMLVLANSLKDSATWFAPFLAATAAVLAFSLDTGVFRLDCLRGRTWILGALGLGVLAWAFTAVPPWLILGPVRLEPLLAILGAVMAVSLTNAALELKDPELPRSREWTAWRFLLSLVTAGIVLALQLAGWVPAWDPNGMQGWKMRG
ncbi:MAG TPA: hypothetical protein VLQ45_19115 [Thermoanaerobaculia bacterium]|nr:hypothetical protein [Thermoanaerobaculia bacterium]